MWQRFTERARKVVFYAQEEAGRLGENYVSTEHLLLGLTRENDSVAARILDKMGVTSSRIRTEIERQVARGDGRLGQDMQLTPRAKRVIDLAYDEARNLDNNYIGTEHLLLGMIREGEGLAGRVLDKFGVRLDEVRNEVALVQGQRKDNSEGKPSGWGSGGLKSLRQGKNKQEGKIPDESLPEEWAKPGDLGILLSNHDFAELVVNPDDYTELRQILSAKDHHGYQDFVASGKVFLVPAQTEVKFLREQRLVCVRILRGASEGRIGWVSRSQFERTGPDERPFPPVIAPETNN